MGNNRNNLKTRYYRDQLVREVQRHPQDFGSMEAKCMYMTFWKAPHSYKLLLLLMTVAKMTAFIRRYQEHMETSPRDKFIKVRLKELIEKRKKFLKYLRRWDYRRFEWILEKLDLVYKPPPTNFHWITRKESLQKLTDIYCEKIKEERLEAYHKELQAQQIPYLEEAIKKMSFVRQEQIDCDVPVTVTEQQIEEARQELARLKEIREAEAAATRKQSDDTFH